MKSLIFTTAVVALLTSGCSDKNTPAPIAPQKGGAIPQAQLDTLNKAKGVEGTLMQADQQRREQIDR